ncbi:MAG: SIMPL domain-containing protein [Burkholderiales bacterium]|nr:SIMPL domain-containing protein [Burkholderiales bacterium]
MRLKNTIKMSIGLLLLAQSSVYALDNSLPLKTISATGHADVTIPQSLAIMNFTISKTSNNAKTAQQDVRSISDKLLKTLKAQNYISLQTSSISISPVMSYKDSTPKITGYTANYAIEVKAKIIDSGNIIDKAVEAGVNNVVAPQLIASDEERNKAKLEAIAQATINAKSQADASLNAIGLKAVDIKQITVNSTTPSTFQPKVSFMRANADAAPNTSIDAGLDTISADVNLVIGY